MYQQVEFTREELFDKVWTTPVLKLAQEIGVSDVALAKACRKADIPLPARGHWAKPAESRPRRPKLPKAPIDRSGPVRFSVLDEAHRSPTTPRPDRDEPRIPVPEPLESPHPLVARTLKALKQTKPYDGRIRPLISEALDVGVSPQQVERALRILDALIRASEARGFRWEIGKEGTRVSCDEEKIRIRLWETLSKQEIPPPPKTPGRKGRWQTSDDSYYYARYEWISTGRLSIQIDDQVATGARRNWSGTANTPLENKLHEIVVGLPLVAAGIRLAREKHEAWQREWDEQEARRKQTARNAEIQRRLRKRLVHSVEQWEQSKRLQTFCEAARSEIELLEGVARTQGEEWLAWANAHADALNPLGHRLPKIAHLEVKLDGWYLEDYRRPPPDWWTTEEE